MGAFFVAVVFLGLLMVGGAFIEVYEAGMARGWEAAEEHERQRTWAALRHVTSQQISQQQASGAWRVARELISSRQER